METPAEPTTTEDEVVVTALEKYALAKRPRESEHSSRNRSRRSSTRSSSVTALEKSAPAAKLVPPRPAQPVAKNKLAHIDEEELAKAKATKPDRPPPAVAQKAAPTKADINEEAWARMMQPPEEPTGTTTAAAASAAAVAELAPAAKNAAPSFADLPEEVRRTLLASPPPKEVAAAKPAPAAKKAPPKLPAPKTVPTRLTGNSPAPIEWTPLMPGVGDTCDAYCEMLSIGLAYLTSHGPDL